MLYSIIWCWVTCVRLQAPQQHDGAQEQKFWGGSNWAERREHAFSALDQVEYFSNRTRSIEEYCNIRTERRWALFFNSLHSHRRFRLWSLHKRHLLGVMNMNLGRIIVTPRNGNFDKIVVTSEGFLLNSLASVGVCETSVVTEELPLTLGLLPILEEYWAWTRMRRILYYIIYFNTYSCLH